MEVTKMPENEEGNVNGKTIEVSARTVDEAIEQGLAQLDLPREQVEIEVVKEGKRGVFGIGSEDAHVRLTPKATGPAESAPPPKVQKKEVAAGAAVEEIPPSPAASSQNQAGPLPAPNAEALSIEFLSGLLQKMGIQAEVTARMAEELTETDEEVPLLLDITGPDLGILIGRRSETLRALQYMVRLMVSKQLNRWYPVVVDVESYRVRRRQSLHQLAEKMAERAVSLKRRVVLEAMPAYERRIIHLALRDHPKVYTKSVGSDDNRKVTIIPK